MNDQDQCVLTGTWFYDGTVPSRVEIWRRGFKPGSGDYEDPPEYGEDQYGEFYEVFYHPPGSGGTAKPAGFGSYPDLSSARASVEADTNGTIRWDGG